MNYPEWRVKTNPEVIGQPRRADGISDQGTPVARLVSIPEISHSFQTDLRQYLQVRSPQSKFSPCRCSFPNPPVPFGVGRRMFQTAAVPSTRRHLIASCPLASRGAGEQTTHEFDVGESGCYPMVVRNHVTEGRLAFYVGNDLKLQGWVSR